MAEFTNGGELESRLRSAVDLFGKTGRDADWQKVLDIVYDYAGQEYDIGYDSGKGK